MKTEKEQLLQELESLKKRIENLDKPKFEVGKWYKGKIYDDFFICITDGECGKGYGFTPNWNDKIIGCAPNLWSLAIPSELESALIKEAVKRGYNKGLWIKSFIANESEIGSSEKVEYRHDEDILNYYGAWVYKQGQWATIIKDEPIKIGGYEVQFTKVGNNPYTTIDGHVFNKQFWLAAKEVSEHLKASIVLGCDAKVPFNENSFACHQWKLDLETINKILSKLND